MTHRTFAIFCRLEIISLRWFVPTVSALSQAIVWAICLLCGLACPVRADQASSAPAAPRIVNIINFIRLLEPRDEAITEDVLFQTVVKQAELMTKHHLPGTFLLQYDALMDSRYQKFLKGLPPEQFEIGGWWELPQPLVEKAGLSWRGRYPWDWHANVGFVSGYTPTEREKLVDVYMADFREIFGHYPNSMASWFIDAQSLAYMHEKYGIVASANCKDQVGTDGYTLWGGYWNQAYYPSKVNAYMPAQTEAGQIPVPIFRMLGSDPLRQYDTGVGHTHQGVITLEPVYADSGGNPAWVDWYFDNFVRGECLAFNYTQAGQENSFTWSTMGRGLEYQFPLIARLREEGQIRVETLAQSGEWFRKMFRTTPATALTYQSALNDDGRQTVWFNSRYYRTSLIWEDATLRVRDIHLFDESVESPIYRNKVDKPAVEFKTLPVVDGFHWSSQAVRAGLRFMTRVDGKEVPLRGEQAAVSHTPSGDLQIIWPLSGDAGQLKITCTEGTLDVTSIGEANTWWLQLETAGEVDLPFTEMAALSFSASFADSTYKVEIPHGRLDQRGRSFDIRPIQGRITLDLDKR